MKDSAYEKHFTSERGAVSSRRPCCKVESRFGRPVRTAAHEIASGSRRSFVDAVGFALFVNLPKLAFTFTDNLEEFPCQLNGLLFGIGPKDGKATDQLFRFRERAVGHTDRLAGTPYPRAESARQAAFRGDQPAGLEPFFDELAHFGHFFLRWWSISFRRLVHA